VRSRETPAESARQPRPWTERSEGSGRERLNCIFPLLALARRKANGERTESEREVRSFLGALNHVQ
jgi:hypothetical protein